MDHKKDKNKSAARVKSNMVSIDLKIAQINLQHCIKATHNYCRDLKMMHTDISLIQEPWIRGSRVHGFGQLHNRLFYNRSGGRPRAAIHVSQNHNAMILNQFSTDDLVVVRICRNSLEGGDFIVASAYLPFDSPNPPPGQSFEKLVDFCSSNALELLIGTDSNSHHTVWGSSDTNKRGEELLQFLAASDLLILNRGRKPTYVNAIREEILDISLATRDISERVRGWRVTDEDTFSDHKLIRFSLEGYAPQRNPYRNPRKTNWSLYREVLHDSLIGLDNPSRYDSAESLDEANLKLTAAMATAYETACPLVKPKPLYKKPLWSDELERKKVQARKAWNAARRTGLDEDYDVFRSLQKEYKLEQGRVHARSKEKFFEEADSIPAYARVHKILAKDPNAQVGSLIKPDGSYTVDSKETAEHLLDIHFPGCVQPTLESTTRPSLHPSRKDWKFAERITKKGKVKWAIHKFQSFKSAGPDGIFPALLKEGLEVILGRLINIFKSSVAFGYIPKIWEKVRVAFIPKPGKTIHSEAKDFRPISLTSFVLKTLERLLDFYIRGEVLKVFPLHANQHAYQVGKSTDTALHQMIHKIELMLNNGKIALGSYIDIEGAFDNTDFEVIIKAAEAR